MYNDEMYQNEIFHDLEDVLDFDSLEQQYNFDDRAFQDGFNNAYEPSPKQQTSNNHDYSDTKEMQFLRNLAAENDMEDVDSFIDEFNSVREQSQIEEWEEEGYNDYEIQEMLYEQEEEKKIRHELDLMNRVHKEHFSRDFDPNYDEIHPVVYQLMEEYPDATLAQAYDAYCNVEGDTFLAGFNSI